MPRTIPLSLLLCATVAACDRAPDDQAVYDTMPRLSLTPAGEICAGSEEPHCQFVNAMLVAVAPDGRAAVADMMGVLREFDRDGRFVRTVGRTGGGPGEYRRLVAAGYDDEGRLTVLDQSAMRVQRFDGAGTVGDATTAPFIPGLIGVGVVQGRVALFALPGAAAIGDTVEARVVLVDPATGDTTALPGLAEPAMATGDGTMIPAPPLFTVLASERWAVSPDGAMHMADGERLRIVRRDSTNAPPRVLVDLAIAPRPVTASDVEAEKAAILEVSGRMGGMPPQVRQMIEAAAEKAPENHPLVDRLVILDDGTLLARESAPRNADSVRWNAFTADGDPVGYLLLPAGVRTAAGTLSRMLLVAPGEDDVPEIRWYEVRREP